MKKLALLAAGLAFLAPAAFAADLININTADSAALESLPGIGTTKASAIIAYRQAHGDFAAISDIQDVSGIGPSTYAEIEPLITVEGGVSSVSSADSSAATASSSSSGSSSGSAAQTSDELPVYVDAGGDRSAAVGADLAYSANVYDASGAAYQSPQVRWAFGDGTTATGAAVEKSYALPGTYYVSVAASAEGNSGEDSFVVTATAPQVKVASSAQGIAITNGDTANALDLSRWELSAGAGSFIFPQGTEIAPGASVTFAPAVTGLSAGSDLALRYPSGAIAASEASAIAPPPAPAQLPAAAPRSIQVQEAAPVSPSPDAEHDEAVVAPAATSELAAAGAPIAPAPAGNSGASLLNIAESPWTLGALGILAFSAAAFMVL